MRPKATRGASDSAKPTKRRLQVRIDAMAYQRLQIHAVMSGVEEGELVTRLITDHCRDWKVSANVISRAIAIDSAIAEHSVDLSEAIQA